MIGMVAHRTGEGKFSSRVNFARVSAWLFLQNTIPPSSGERWNCSTKISPGENSPLFLTAEFSPRNSPLAKFSLPLYALHVPVMGAPCALHAPSGREKIGLRGGRTFEPIFQNLPAAPPWAPESASLLCLRGFLRGCRGGGGSVGTPTYVPQNDPHDALIILNIHKGGDHFFQNPSAEGTNKQNWLLDLGARCLKHPPPNILGLETPPQRNSGPCHVCTGGSQHKAQKENGLVSGL